MSYLYQVSRDTLFFGFLGSHSPKDCYGGPGDVTAHVVALLCQQFVPSLTIYAFCRYRNMTTMASCVILLTSRARSATRRKTIAGDTVALWHTSAEVWSWLLICASTHWSVNVLVDVTAGGGGGTPGLVVVSGHSCHYSPRRAAWSVGILLDVAADDNSSKPGFVAVILHSLDHKPRLTAGCTLKRQCSRRCHGGRRWQHTGANDSPVYMYRLQNQCSWFFATVKYWEHLGWSISLPFWGVFVQKICTIRFVLTFATLNTVVSAISVMFTISVMFLFSVMFFPLLVSSLHLVSCFWLFSKSSKIKFLW